MTNLQATYQKQFQKLMLYIKKQYIPSIPKEDKSSILRLELMVDSYEK